MERFDLWRIRARAKHNAPNNESPTKLSGIDEKVVLLFVAEEISEATRYDLIFGRTPTTSVGSRELKYEVERFRPSPLRLIAATQKAMANAENLSCFTHV